MLKYTGCPTRSQPLMFAYQNQINGQLNEIYYGHALVYEKHGDFTASIGSGRH